jgi:hypothetical protein
VITLTGNAGGPVGVPALAPFEQPIARPEINKSAIMGTVVFRLFIFSLVTSFSFHLIRVHNNNSRIRATKPWIQFRRMSSIVVSTCGHSWVTARANNKRTCTKEQGKMNISRAHGS